MTLRARSARACAVPFALAALLLAGCAPAADLGASPEPSPTATSSSAPTPTPTEPEPVLEPTIAFDGDCSRVLSDGQLDDLLGEGWLTRQEQMAKSNPDGVPIPLISSAETLGGLACDWFADVLGDEGEVRRLTVTVLPADQVPSGFAADFATARCDTNYDASSCRLARRADDAWVMVRVGNYIYEPPVEFLESVLGAVEASIGDDFDGRAADPAPQWWPVPDCEQLGTAMVLEDLMGVGYYNGFWEGSEQPEQTLFAEAGVGQICPWSSSLSQPAPDHDHHIIELYTASGASWQWEAFSGDAGAEQVTVAGAEDAVAFPLREGYDVVFVTDGVNIMTLFGAPKEFLVQVAERALGALAA